MKQHCSSKSFIRRCFKCPVYIILSHNIILLVVVVAVVVVVVVVVVVYYSTPGINQITSLDKVDKLVDMCKLASNRAAEENAAWIQLFRLSQQFPEIWYF